MDPQGKSRPKRVVLKIAVETWMIGPDIFQEDNMLHTLICKEEAAMDPVVFTI